MRKFLLIFTALFVMAVSVNAQEKGDMAVGAKFAIGTGDDYTNYGLGVKFQWNFADKVRLEPSFTYFFENDDLRMWDLSLNVHYQFVLSEGINIYPLAGFTIVGAKVDIAGVGSNSESEFGINLGVGADFDISKKISLNIEMPYKIVNDFNRFVPSVGIAYKF